jgi:hypothetical protein
MLQNSDGQRAPDVLIPIPAAAAQIGATVRRLRYAVRSGEVKGGARVRPIRDLRVRNRTLAQQAAAAAGCCETIAPTQKPRR